MSTTHPEQLLCCHPAAKHGSYGVTHAGTIIGQFREGASIDGSYGPVATGGLALGRRKQDDGWRWRHAMRLPAAKV